MREPRSERTGAAALIDRCGSEDSGRRQVPLAKQEHQPPIRALQWEASAVGAIREAGGVLLGCGGYVVGMGLPGESIPVIVEPLKLPEPAREPDRVERPKEPAPTTPHAPKEPAPA